MQNCRFKWHEIVKIKHFCVVMTSASAANFRSADLNTQTQQQQTQSRIKMMKISFSLLLV